MATARWTWRASALIAGLTLGTVGCGGAPEPQIIGPDPCIAGQADLKQRLGPEFAKMVTTEGFARDRLRGCALIYLRVAEELPEEMPDGDDLDLATDHQLAFAFSRGGAPVALSTVERSKMAPGPVTLKLSLADLTGDGIPDVIAREQQGEFGMTGYRGLRIFDWSQGTAREVFARKLEITTPEGLSMVPEWKSARADGQPAIVFDGAGTRLVFLWDSATRRFGPAKTPTPKAPTPPVAAPAAPAEAAPAEEAKEDGAKEDGAKEEKESNVLEELGL